MKVKDLIQELSKYDPDMEVTTITGDDILGDYQMSKDLYIREDTGGLDNHGALWCTISNYYDPDMKKETVLVIS